jgi:signal transduction histidine kinase
MRAGVRGKLVVLSLLILVVVSFGFTMLQLHLSRGWVEEDLRERAVFFAREIAATIGDRREFESSELLGRKIQQLLAVRKSVLQLDIMDFLTHDATVLASSHPGSALAFTPGDILRVRDGAVVSRLVTEDDGRYWEVMAPVVIDHTVAGGVAAKFSLKRFDVREERTRWSALVLTAVSVLVMGTLMGIAVHIVVNRPVARFMDAIRRSERGVSAPPVVVNAGDEFGVLARHFNEMMDRIAAFNSELQVRVAEATAELTRRYEEVQRLHEQLFSMQRSLSHAERLALSGRIMVEVAHEVGTPLHSVAGHLELLRQDLPAPVVANGAGRRLQIIESQVARVTQIIARLLDLTRQSQGDMERVDLNRMVQETVELVRPSVAAAGLCLRVEAQRDLARVEGYKNQLQQVVLNLVTNAMDATPAKGTITITTRDEPDDARVELEVIDTGGGIPAEQRDHICEPFFSTKSGRGIGLGLFISAEIVREHKGHIEVTSEPGRGSSFRVVLPAVVA